MLIHTREHYGGLKAQLKSVQQGCYHLKEVIQELKKEIKEQNKQDDYPKYVITEMEKALQKYLQDERLEENLEIIIKDVDEALQETKNNHHDEIFNDINENLNQTIQLNKNIYEFIDKKREILERYQIYYDQVITIAELILDAKENYQKKAQFDEEFKKRALSELDNQLKW